MNSEGTKVGEMGKNNLVELPSLLKHNHCNPEAITVCSETAYMSHAGCVERPVCQSKTKSVDGLLLQNCIALFAFGHEERKSSHVVICPRLCFRF